MINHSPAQQRTGFTISPLLVIGMIFVGLCVIEGLLAARFWLQLAASSTPDGLGALVLDISHPLVAPFTDARAGAQDVGSFDRKTLVAAIAYLVGAVSLTVVTILVGGILTGNAMITRSKRRSSLQHFEHPLIEHSKARLIGTAMLSMSPEEASRALKIMRLDRFDMHLYVIPASGGCIVAAFASSDGGRQLPILGRIGATREAMAVKRALSAIEQRFHPEMPAPGLKAGDLVS